MGFYYFSLFSWMVFAAYFAIGAAIISKVCKASKLCKRWMVTLLTVAFIAPWTEELWIAYNFGQLCRKDAGKFIYKTVEVDGFYDDVTEWGPPQLSERPFKFMESRDNLSREKLWRVERADEDMRNRAIVWDAEQNKGKPSAAERYIEYPVSDNEKIMVAPNHSWAWRRIRIDKPTARYHYSMDRYGIPVSHKVNRQEYRVEDSVAKLVLGKYVAYSRKAYWFFIGLDAPGLSCNDLKPKSQRTTHGILEDVIQPKK